MANKNGSYPPSVHPGIPKLPPAPIGWKRVSLKPYLREIKRPVNLDDETSYQLITVKRSRGGAIERGWLKGKEIKVKSQGYVRLGDFLISKRQIVHGACALVPQELDGAIVSNEYSILNTNKDLDRSFLNYLADTLYFQQTCFHSSIGVHIEKMIFKLDWWYKWKFNIPPVPEQTKIARILSTWDRAIDTTEKLIENSRQQKKALMQQLLTGKKRLPGFEGEWKRYRLERLIYKIVGGGTPKRNNAQYWNGNIPWVTVKDLNGEIINGAKECITTAGLQESASNLIPAGTVIIATRMAVGKSVVSECDVAINQDLKAIFPKAILVPGYLRYWLLYKAKFVERIAGGSTVKGVSLSTIRNLEMLLPISVDEQKSIVCIIAKCSQQITMMETYKAKLYALKRALMQQLLTGKRRVKVDELIPAALT